MKARTSEPIAAGDLRDGMVILTGQHGAEEQIVEHVKVLHECKMRVSPLSIWERTRKPVWHDIGPVRNDTTYRVTRKQGPIPAETRVKIPHMPLFD